MDLIKWWLALSEVSQDAVRAAAKCAAKMAAILFPQDPYVGAQEAGCAMFLHMVVGETATPEEIEAIGRKAGAVATQKADVLCDHCGREVLHSKYTCVCSKCITICDSESGTNPLEFYDALVGDRDPEKIDAG